MAPLKPNCLFTQACSVSLFLLLSAAPLWAAEPINPAVRTYGVNRRVSAFPTNEDLSTPEAAYATITRAWIAEGLAAFPRLSVHELAKAMSSPPRKPAPAQEAAMWLDAEVLEVNVYHQTNACVFARLNVGGKERIDLRWLKPEKGRWLNDGNDMVGTLD